MKKHVQRIKHVNQKHNNKKFIIKIQSINCFRYKLSSLQENDLWKAIKWVWNIIPGKFFHF